MRAQDAVGFDVDDFALLLAEEAAQEVVVVYFAQEADALRVFAACGRQLGLQGDAPHLFLHQVSDREEQTLHLHAGQLRQEVGLVLHRIFGGAEPGLPVALHDGGVVSRGDFVVAVSDLLLEGAELDEPVAHHVGVGSQSGFHALHGVAHHALPVLLLQVDDLKGQPVASRGGPAELHILFGGAARVFLALHADLDVVEVGSVALLGEQVQGDGGIYAAGEQQSDVHPSMMSVMTSLMSRPAARTCWGMKLVAVMPGVVLISSRLILPSTMM